MDERHETDKAEQRKWYVENISPHKCPLCGKPTITKGQYCSAECGIAAAKKSNQKQSMKIESDALTLDQYKAIMKEIWENHRWVNSDFEHSKHIKYVRPNWDMRDGKCFSIQFDPGEKIFSCGYGETEPMYDRIMNWLAEGHRPTA